ncbi:hypothetical protein Tco_0562528, partial [Tanacetum coccineum]
VFSVHNWTLKPNQPKEPPFNTYVKAICNLDVPVDSKAPKPSSQTEEVPQGKKLGAKSRLGRKQSSKHTSESKTEASKSKTGQSEKDTQHNKQLVVHPQLSSDQTKYVGDGLKTAHTNLDIRSTFFTPDSLQDDPIIVSDESEEEEIEKAEDTHATSHDLPKDTSVPHPPSPKSAQIQELMAHVAELKNIQWELPTEFLDLPSQISSVQKNLKTLDSLPSLLNKVSKTLNRFATVVENASRATTKDVPSAGQAIASPAEGEKNINPATKDAEPNLHDELVDLLGIDVVTQFTTMVENASGATSMNVPSASKATASPAEWEKNTKDADTNLKDELVDLFWGNSCETLKSLKLLQRQLFRSLEDWEVSSLQCMQRYAKRHAFWSLNEEISRYCSDNLYTVSIKEDTAYLCLHFTRNHKELKSNTLYPGDSIRRIKDYLKIQEYIKRGPYSKKPSIRRIDLNQYGVSTDFQ